MCVDGICCQDVSRGCVDGVYREGGWIVCVDGICCQHVSRGCVDGVCDYLWSPKSAISHPPHTM